MSIIIFFGLSIMILVVGLVFVTLTLRYHWKQSHSGKKQDGLDQKQTSLEESKV